MFTDATHYIDHSHAPSASNAIHSNAYDLNKAISLEPNDRIAYANRARAYIYLRMDEQAKSDIEKAVGLGFDRSILERDIQQIKTAR